MSENIIQRSFKINLTVLIFFGLYPSKNVSILTRIKSLLFYFLSFILVSVFVIIDVLSENNYDSLQMNFIAIWLVETIGFTFKILPLLKEGNRIMECVNFFGQPRFKPQNNEEKNIINECVSVCYRNCTAYFYGIIGCVTVWTFPVVLTKDYKLPINCWLPYNPNANLMTYYATLVYLFLVVVYDAFSGTMIDPVIGGLAYHATCQMKILKYNLKHLGWHTKNWKDYPIIRFEDVHKNLQRCICLHNDILNFVTEFEECFSWSVFCQLTASTIGLGFSCIGFILVPTKSYETLIYLVCFLIFCFQIFFYCHYGTLLFEENNGLITAIYMGSWYNCDVRIRKILITIMERAKKLMVVTSGKIIDLTYETFVSVLKTSYSLIAVLNNYD